jgi:hypothetical protein
MGNLLFVFYTNVLFMIAGTELVSMYDAIFKAFLLNCTPHPRPQLILLLFFLCVKVFLEFPGH